MLENFSKQFFKTIECDIVVVGGGLSGVFAAIGAKRQNPDLNIWLVERYGFLGGMATAGYVFPFMKYFTNTGTLKFKRLSGGLFQEMLGICRSDGYCEKIAVSDFYSRFDPMMLRVVLDKMVLNEKINLLFHTMVNHVEYTTSKSGNKKITEIYAQTKAGTILFQPKFIIDSSGDADIVHHSGVEMLQGRESDGLVQPATLNFRMGNIGYLRANRKSMTKKILKVKAQGNPLTQRDDALYFMTLCKRENHFNQTRVSGFDFTDPIQMTAAEIEGRAQAERFIKFLRSDILGYKNSSVVGLGTQLGIRETRRIIGEYYLTEKDLLSCKIFDDRIALANYSIDIHDPDGTGKTDIRRIPDGKWYTIPFRSLIPKGLENVLVAGRPISANHVAHSAIRVMPICSCIGHAAGVAVGLLLKEYQNKTIRDVPIERIQNELRKQKAILD